MVETTHSTHKQVSSNQIESVMHVSRELTIEGVTFTIKVTEIKVSKTRYNHSYHEDETYIGLSWRVELFSNIGRRIGYDTCETEDEITKAIARLEQKANEEMHPPKKQESALDRLKKQGFK
jgi:hypothetical protein